MKKNPAAPCPDVLFMRLVNKEKVNRKFERGGSRVLFVLVHLTEGDSKEKESCCNCDVAFIINGSTS